MEKKEIKPMVVFFKQFETTLKEINTLVGNTPALIAEEALKSGYKISGPQIWNYTGADGNPDTKFTVDICFPVESPNEFNDPSIKTLENHSCACYVLKGPWSELYKTYSILTDEMKEKGLIPSTVCREVYHLCDFITQQNCITEIQMGYNKI